MNLSRQPAGDNGRAANASAIRMAKSSRVKSGRMGFSASVAIVLAACLAPSDRAQAQEFESASGLPTITGCVNSTSGRLRFAVPNLPCTNAEQSIEWPQLLDVAPANLVRGCIEPSTGALTLFRWGFGPPVCASGLVAYDWAV